MTPLHKALSHWLKARVYATESLDAWLEEHLGRGAGQALYHRLFPERAQRPLMLQQSVSRPERRISILSLVPPEDTGGGSRPARLAAEFQRAGWAIDWRWALPIFPWPARTRPTAAETSIHHISENQPLAPSDLVLVEAPHPAFLPLLETIPGNPRVLYEQIDLWRDDLAAGWFQPAVEQELMMRADFLSATSKVLCDSVSWKTSRPCAYNPNAADIDQFDPELDWPRPADLQPGAPTLVYVGALWGEWVDLELIARVADELPEAQIHLIGRTGSRTIPTRPNLHLLGEKPRESIPGYLQHADAALVPFCESAVAAAVSPLKAFEALVMGCPLVSTPIPEMVAIPEVVTAPADGFAAALTRVSRARPSAEHLARLRADASWTQRVEAILDLTGLR